MLTSFQHVNSLGSWLSMGFLVFLLLWESLQPFFLFFKSKARERTRHGFGNILLGLLNALMISLLFVGLWLGAAEWADRNQWGLLNLGHLPTWAKALGAVLLFDLWTYWWHRANHELSFLWRFHRVHHSDNHMDVTTANRFHLGEILISSCLRVPLIILFGAELWHLALYEAIMFPIVELHHANIGFSKPTDRFLRTLVVTPAMHKVHHSRWQPETNSNYTSLLSIWDRLFKTFRIREHPEEIELGLEGYDNQQRIRDLLSTPFHSKKE